MRLNKFLLILLLANFVIGCAIGKAGFGEQDTITQEEVIALLQAGKVKGVHQPHFGYVRVDLKDGATKWHAQDKMNWIITYIYSHNLQSSLEYVSME